MKVGKDFLSTLSEQIPFGEKYDLPMPLSFMSRGHLPRKTLGDAVLRAAIEINETNHKMYVSNVNEYVKHLQKKGSTTLKGVANLIKAEISPNMNLTNLVKTMTDDYVTALANYHIYLINDTPETQIDKESTFLDLIEMSNRMLYGEERKLLNDALVQANVKNASIVQSLNEKIYKRSVKVKKEEMFHICNTYDVCRIYPAFSDYCADFISEILKLEEDKFKLFLDYILEIVKNHEGFLETLTEKEDRELMSMKLKSYYSDIYGMKEFFAVSRAVMTQRFKTFETSNQKLKMRTKAMRILLDIIDKALSMEDDVLDIDFKTTMSALRSWAGGLRENIQDIFREFANHLIRELEFKFTRTARDEISCLVELVVRGGTEKTDMYQRLFKYGSTYVSNKDLDSDPLLH
ncbi:unnamed protein product [Chrysodeixis includens]|uniref:Uncharacterized protein n=1 Tax=Chrysodeixis includens TaxID=689277 RepID=A0A9N8L540_CHRIL|nr:unnamed protein product [Chrysodeixis includens]